MKSILRLLTLILWLISSAATAQDSMPVQFSFKALRTADSTVQLKWVAVKPGKIGLLSLVDHADSTGSQLTINGTLIGTAAVSYAGGLKAANDAALGQVRLFGATDTVTAVLGKLNGSRVKGSFSYLGIDGNSYPSGRQEFNVPIEETVKAAGTSTLSAADNPGKESRSFASTILLSFLAGLAAVFTPCVFPLIAVTVSYFTKKNLLGDKKAPVSRWAGIQQALIYSLSIILIYTIPTLVLTLIFGDTALYRISTSPITNLLFFAVFILFAISFFGAFELTMPSSWATKADEKAGKGGYTGIFFMALTLVIVSFSCTGPFVGSLLAQTSTQGISLAPVLGILSFSVGLALPFTLLAVFPTLLGSLPRSGGWLNSVKAVFGFVELALALKFLSNVDLIYHWGILDREVFLSCWIVLAFLLGFYLLGKLRFAHDDAMETVSVPRLFLATAIFSFAVYLVPGLWGAPLKGLAGLLPPATTQDFDLHNRPALPAAAMSALAPELAPKKLTDKLKMPLGLTGYFDLEEAKAASRALNKPILIDFTGHSCANCRKMEEEVWAKPEVLNMLRNDFVLLSLYADEKTALQDAEIYTNAQGKVIETVGEKNSDFEKTRFGTSALPLYMFIDANEKLLVSTEYSYDSDVDKFLNHLKTVKQAYAVAQK